LIGAYVGIDPGKKGAVCLIDFTDTPIFWDLSKHSIKDIFLSLRAHPRIELVAIEKQHAMPGQGVSSTFTTGFGYGRLIGHLEASRLPYIEVSAREWQKGLKLPKTKSKAQHKKNLYEIASGLYPTADFKGPKGGLLDGRSDANLIADWARRRNA
jgi:hypothetical protein